jgi:hypothetical protein
MKKTIMSKMGVAAAMTFACGGVALAVWLAGVSGQSSVPGRTALADLSGVSAPELPAMAARLVAQVAPGQRDAKTVEVIQAVNALSRPAALPYVVSAIAAECPDVTAAALNQVVALQPEAGVDCAKAALAAAPGQTANIIAAICRQQPEKYSEIALAAAAQAPQKSAEIYAGLTAGLPQLKPLVAKATDAAGSDRNVAAVIEQLHVLVVSAARGEASAASEHLAMPATAASTATRSMLASKQPTTVGNSFTPLVPVAQRGLPTVTPLTPPATQPADTAVRNTSSTGGRPYSAP